VFEDEAVTIQSPDRIGTLRGLDVILAGDGFKATRTAL
jgi:hypothetical protein